MKSPVADILLFYEQLLNDGLLLHQDIGEKWSPRCVVATRLSALNNVTHENWSKRLTGKIFIWYFASK
jgi:hypothetical protein